ncbi:protein FAR1-RELATED SEQUENCE 5-like [Tripterygium wilfordii]|uniref:protein FAR1-RELATED SEQUENCE 5-like n=1 Tax=Tripterygium wilfordii TaxID=458696 RepID=UPI0018F841ED|nr:protein FAR1-RELATED SEQUENCE 5-like [Tripterygium wilfordii]
MVMDSEFVDVSQGDVGSSSSNMQTYVPNVVCEKIPKVGQEFESFDESQNYYNEYAREAGFSVRLSSTKRNKSNEFIRREFVCFKEGIREEGSSKSNCIRKRGLTREGCKAKMIVVKSTSKPVFVVTQFHAIHNHILTTPRKVHMLRSHRSMSNAKKALTQQFAAANIPIHQQISILEVQAGGIENIGCIEKDFYNARRDEVKSYAGHDAQMLYEYFQAEKDKNPEFFFTFKMDVESKVTHCFWADSGCRRAYAAFGDVVVFDTTYNTNRYSMIFAPFVGVNHHGRTILLACAFLSDETTESFLRLLQQLLAAMPAGAPKMIITDQDPAMTRAIGELFPHTVHRYCMWHILSKFSEKLDAIKWKEHYTEFHKCIWESESPDEFEVAWSRVIQHSGFSGNEWLKGLYDIRHKWIPAYVNGTFSAGMSSSQRVEGCHSFFKKFVSKKNTLMDFVVRFTRALKHQRHQELALDHKDVNEHPILKTMCPIEKKTSELYTQSIFYKFQEELYQSMAYIVAVDHDIIDKCMYHVHRDERGDGRVRKVIEDKATNYMSCSYKKFESCGIVCRHILATFSRIQLAKPLLDVYMLRRWTKAAKSLSPFNVAGERVNCDASLVVYHNTLHKLASNIIDDAFVSRETCELAIELFESVHNKIKSMSLSDGQQSIPSVALSEPVYQEPDKVVERG